MKLLALALETVDDWLIARIEQFCHWSQRWFGLASPSWERFFLCLGFVQFGVREIPQDWGHGWIALDALIGLWFMGRFVDSLYRTPPIGDVVLRNPRKLADRYSRPANFLLALFFFPIDLIIPKGNLWFQCSVLAQYCSACDDLPQGPSKVRTFFAAIAAARSRPQAIAAFSNSSTVEETSAQ